MLVYVLCSVALALLAALAVYVVIDEARAVHEREAARDDDGPRNVRRIPR